MFRNSSQFVVAAVCLLFPAQVLAGGPPWLCLPIDGVTAENAKECESLLSSKLENKVWEGRNGVKIYRHADQLYMAFHMRADVALSEIETALKGTSFSIPRDKLRFFGYAILEIDAGKTPSKELIAALEAMDQVSIEKSENKDNVLLATVVLPSDSFGTHLSHYFAALDRAQGTRPASDQSNSSDLSALSRKLPGYRAMRDVLAKQHASLKDIRWSTMHACRTVGGMPGTASDSVASVKQSK